MKICKARRVGLSGGGGRSSSLLAALMFLSLAGLAGAFSTQARITAVRGGREGGAAALEAVGKDPPSSQRKTESAPIVLGEKTRNVRDQLRDAIWKATDYIDHAMEDMPEIGKSNTNQTLTRLGSMLESIDEKYFSKYLTAGAKPTYQETLAASSTTLERGSATAASPKVASSSSAAGKAKTEAKVKVKSAKDAASDKLSSAKTAAGSAAKGASAAVASASETTEKATGKPVAAAVTSASPKDKVGSASGTVQLDRPKQVQGVFDEIQKKAVEYYKTTPPTTPSEASSVAGGGAAAGGGVATPMPEAVQILEAKLESLLTESRFRPRKLRKDKKSSLVDAIGAMEAAYPADANPLGDPALSGQWSVVYSSSSRLIGRALKGLLAGFFKTSDARQVVDTGASSVINACRARLRMTPLTMRVARKGSYRATGERKVYIDMPPTKKGLLRRLLPTLRSGEVEAEVTYLSNKWRICRAGGVTVAFRKSGV